MQVFYTVRRGDSLSLIAARWRIPLNSLIFANNLSAPYTIYPEQQLSMPPGVTTYVVRPGDTIAKISQIYGTPINIILEANGIDPPYIIYPGQVLKVSEGVLYYTVRPGDTLYRIASRYNVSVNGIPKPDFIIKANDDLTSQIYPGMNLAIPYPPPGGTGRIGAVLSDGFNNFIVLYDASSGNISEIEIDEADRASNIFWSPDGRKLAFVNGKGVITVIDAATKGSIKIDQTSLPTFVDWSKDSTRIIYTNGRVIRIYNVQENSFSSFNRPGAAYVQWFPGSSEILFEAKDSTGLSQLYKSESNGSNERQITGNGESPKNNVRLSPDGRYALFTSPGASISIIYVYELASGRLFKIPGGPEAKNFNPEWSPDSTMIAYSSTQFINGKYYSLIRVTSPTGAEDRTLAISSCYSTPVSWSPDSRRVSYLSGCREDIPPVEIWVTDIEKPVPLNVLYGFFFYALDWQ